MNRTCRRHPIRRLACALAGLATALLAMAAAAPAAFALPVPPRPAATRPGHRPRCTPSSLAACPAGRSPSSP
jgi:hypothetical protein